MSTSIACPACGNVHSTVKDTRPTTNHKRIYRRRVCRSCQNKWSTTETSDEESQFNLTYLKIRQIHALLDRLTEELESHLPSSSDPAS